MDFWENVEAVREYKGITRKELAHDAKFSLNSISTGIARHSIPAADVAYRIAVVLGVSVEYLITGQHAQKSKSHNVLENNVSAKILKQNLLIKQKYSNLIHDMEMLSPKVQKSVAKLIHDMTEV